MVVVEETVLSVSVKSQDRHETPIRTTMVESSDGIPAPALDHGILRQRLLQGIGAGNAARGSLSKCLIKYREFLAVYLAGDNADDVEKAKQDLVRDVGLYQVDMKKVALSLLAASHDTRGVETQIVDIESSIESVQAEIEDLRRAHPEAKQVRRNLEEYEALAKMASTRPSRRVSEERSAKVKIELEQFEASILKSNEDKSIREKQFHLFMQSMFDLKESFENDADTTEHYEKQNEEEDEGEVKPMDIA
jgi:Tho complex subunit 7